MEILCFDSLNILVNVKAWRESIATVITATVSMASVSLATEDVEVTESSSQLPVLLLIFVLRE